MKRDSIHTHPCRDCRTPTECEGELLQNFDGHPETICHSYHVRGTPTICEACALAARGGCHVCGDPASIVVDDESHADGYRGDVLLCQDCAGKPGARV